MANSDNSGNSNWGLPPDPTARLSNVVRTAVPLDRGWHRLGQAVRIGLGILLLIYVAEMLLYVWGLSMFEESVEAGDVDILGTYDDLDMALSAAAFLMLLVAGILWMTWQYRLAKSTAAGQLRRGPGWHAFSWITPIVGLWFPYQNIKDLWVRRFPDRSTAILAWWWIAFLVTNVMDRVYVRQMDDTESTDDLIDLVQLELTSTVIGAVALLLAIRIHRTLSDAELNAVPAPTLVG